VLDKQQCDDGFGGLMCPVQNAQSINQSFAMRTRGCVRNRYVALRCVALQVELRCDAIRKSRSVMQRTATEVRVG
jgi:hypothetical protein